MLILIPGLLIFSSFAVLINSAAPDQGYTGADGAYCTSCHNTNTLNSGGGSVSAPDYPPVHTQLELHTISVSISSMDQ